MPALGDCSVAAEFSVSQMILIGPHCLVLTRKWGSWSWAPESSGVTPPSSCSPDSHRTTGRPPLCSSEQLHPLHPCVDRSHPLTSGPRCTQKLLGFQTQALAEWSSPPHPHHTHTQGTSPCSEDITETVSPLLQPAHHICKESLSA